MNSPTKIRYHFFCLFAVISILFSCSKSGKASLSKVESLLNSEELDSAALVMKGISYAQLSGDDEKNLYALLKTRINIMNDDVPESDTLISQILSYYLEKKDLEKISDCYYYKGIIDCANGNMKKALWDMYSAEHYITQTDNINITHKVYEKLVDLNCVEGDIKLADHYAKLALKLSTIEDNKNWLAYSYLSLSYITSQQNKASESKKYISKAIKLIEYVSKKDRAQFYVALGNYSHNYDDMEKYYEQAVNLYPSPYAYSALCAIEYKKKNYAKADSLLEKTLSVADVSVKISTCSILEREAVEQLNYEDAHRFSSKLNAFQEERYEKMLKDNASMIHRDYDYQMQELQFKQKIVYVLYALTAIVGILLIIYFVYRYRVAKTQKTSLENQLLLNIYKERLNKLNAEMQDEKNIQESEALQKKVDEYQNKQSKILYEGKKLYQDIKSGKNTLTWSKHDYEEFIEYYRLIDLPFIVQLETEYDHLSPRYQFYMVLVKEGLSDEDIQKIMVITPAGLRTIRFRVNAKKLS